MEVLKNNQMFFMWLGICPIKDHSKQFSRNLFGWLAVINLVLVIITGSLSVIHYGLNDLENALYAAFPVAASLRVMVALIMMISHQQKVTKLFERLQTFFDQS